MAEINVDIKPNKNSLFLWNEVLPADRLTRERSFL